MSARLVIAACIALLSAFGCMREAYAERLIVSVSNHRVTVTPNYSGEELVLFGAVEKDATTPQAKRNYDLVVTIFSAKEPSTSASIRSRTYFLNSRTSRRTSGPGRTAS